MTAERLPRWWWCDLHRTVHEGGVFDFNDEHRMHLHPVYAHINNDRRNAVAATTRPETAS